jgi:hypothetical protein
MIRRGQEGWHAKIEPPSLDSPVTIICDEAKSIPDPIFEAFSGRCTFNALLYISSTGEMGGAFARSQDKGSDFIRYHITYADCEHILDKKRVEALKTFYPADDPFLRSTLYAEFMDHTGDAGRFCSLAVIRKWIENPAEERSGETVAFCDFAGGGNENVLAIRRGDRVRIAKAWREVNEMVAIGEFIALFREQNLKPHQIYGDNAGAGKPMIARLGSWVGRSTGLTGRARR